MPGTELATWDPAGIALSLSSGADFSAKGSQSLSKSPDELESAAPGPQSLISTLGAGWVFGTQNLGALKGDSVGTGPTHLQSNL